MFEKEYYSLDEVTKRYNVNLPTLKKFIDEGKITPVFYLARTKLVFGGVDKASFFVGYGVGEYEGMFSIQRKQFSKLWHENRVSANFLILHNMQNIMNYSEVNPFPDIYSRGLITSWQATPLASVSRSKILAICLPELKSYKRFYQKGTYESLDPAIEYDPSEIVESEWQWLTEDLLDIKFSEACVSYSDLVNVGVVAPNISQIILQRSKSESFNAELKYATPFQTLIAKILEKHPNISNKKLFKILQLEAHADIDEREFDTDNTLADEVDGVILWNDVTCKTGLRKCSYNTLKNPVRDVKIAMRAKSD